MKLFISHAVADKVLASRFKELIESVSLGLATTWLSSAIDGLRPGDVLWNEIHQNLSTSDKIISLLTPNSLQRAWILYESGFVAGNKKANVIPIIFNLEKSDLPLPLSAYVTYQGDSFEELESLLIQIVSEVAPIPNKLIIKAGIESFFEQIEPIRADLEKVSEARRTSTLDNQRAESTKIIDKLKASELFQQKLADPLVKSVILITYTNEVESGSINHYRVKGSKTIRVFKRSIIADLREQQETNLRRIGIGSDVEPWDKHSKLLDSTIRLEDEFKRSKEVTVTHFFYDAPPIKRAYIFDECEALVSYYETVSDPLNSDRSIYKGMGDSNSLWVSNKTSFGKFVLDELLENVRNLTYNSRTWSDEQYILANPIVGCGRIRMPCTGLKTVLLDLDGLLHDSMIFYEKAWIDAFLSVGVKISVKDVYLQEGNQSELTVQEMFHQYRKRLPTEDELKKVVDLKNEILQACGRPEKKEGALDLLSSIRASGLNSKIVTSSTRKDLQDILMEDFGEFISPNDIISGLDVSLRKPDPTPFLLAASKSLVLPTECVVIENSPLGTTAASRAGMLPICINSGPLDDHILVRHGAIVVFKDCTDLASKWGRIADALRTSNTQ